MELLKQKELESILVANLIFSLGNSSWIKNLVPTRKKSGEITLCVDFNRELEKDKYPISHAE